MSNIDGNIPVPEPNPTPSPDIIPPVNDPANDHVGSDDIREPGDGMPPVEPDPEERGPDVPSSIRRG